ncbi:MAG: ATP-dependent Clp protease adapter ClpS [Ferrovum sp.]|nr:ATP-dependent Clp protease adapter ClpS [Ferrovum sp.]NDU88105.1 ATP-dependent Clp protease adapter ClpS [Ferrovum sp.]
MNQKNATMVEKQAAKVKPPALFDVVLLNDDYTPMDFVVEVLEQIFSLGREAAVRVMLRVHTEGRGVCGTYPRDIAATRVSQVVNLAREAQHPLQCIMEERES